MKTSKEVHPMDELKEKLKDILKLIPPGSKVYYIDYPMHANGGDLLIMKGTEKFFHDYNIKVTARYSVLDFPEKLNIPEDQLIVLHGGGNFGDLYPYHQKLRERIVAAYPNHRIVIMPQTIYFSSDEEFEKSARILNRHKDLHLMVRDHYSYELAKEKLTCSIYLSPDMAHQLWPLAPVKAAHKKTLFFLRNDLEAGTSQNTNLLQSAEDCKDWGTLFNTYEILLVRIIAKLHVLKKHGLGIIPTKAIWYGFSDYLLQKTLGLFSSYETIQTSRLHGHILSCLLDKPNVIIDNSYGKNSNYFKTWTYRCTVSQTQEQESRSMGIAQNA
ncbi:polysaccharide pyruvyl transferase family protein [Gorillibacterium sp. sgz5001074]|uniref:polysaccharide pyruvyl transferase family protein n=1 Tax=Gorillibacterium sp. sgz5001074 TaxID=3446695 RepID=UPI003F680D83